MPSRLIWIRQATRYFSVKRPQSLGGNLPEIDQAWDRVLPSTSLILAKHIVIVDDDDEVRRSFNMLLRARGFMVKAFETGTELLAFNKIAESACLLLDYRLPDMNGIELLQSLRRSGQDNPAFLITGDPLPSIRPRASSAGFLGVIEKPADANQLAELLSLAIEGHA